MADALTLPAVGADVAVDTVDSKYHQLVKIEYGAAGSATEVSATNPLPVGGAAADDAAAAGNPVPVGAVYQAAADAVDDGDVGRLRMTARRGLVEACDYTWGQARGNGAATAGDISDVQAKRGSGAWENLTGNVAEYLSAADAAFDNQAIYFAIPVGVSGWRKFTVVIDNYTGVSITGTLYFLAAHPSSLLSTAEQIAATAATAHNAKFIAHTAHATNLAWTGAPGYAYIIVIPASDPSSGDMILTIQRST